MPKEAAYGQYFMAADDMPADHAQRILGFRVARSGDEVLGIDLHYELAGGEARRLTIPVSSSSYLQLLLTLLQLDEGLPFPEDPRDRNWRPPAK
jgi:hypothetical protein